MAERGRDLVYGVGPLEGALAARRRRLLRLWVAPGRTREPRIRTLVEAARAGGCEIREADAAELGRRAPGAQHQGLVAEAERLPEVDLATVLAPGPGGDRPLVVLDQVQDPHNLGAILRGSEAAGARAVVKSKDRAAPLTPVAVKVAEGAADHLPVVTVVNLARALAEIRDAGLWCIGLEATAARPIWEVDLARPVALVLGSEGHGLRRLVRESCDELAAVPMPGRMPSLNVSVAAAVVLYESLRQRRTGPGERRR